MPFLTISGVTVPVAVDSASLRYVDAGGESARSPGGTLEGGPLTEKREWAMATPPVPPSELDAWVGLIRGDGHSWPYNSDFYSARGRGPVSSVGSSIITSGMKYGAGYLSTPLGEGMTYNVATPAGWTILLWRKESGVWRHYMVRSDHAVWKDGVRDDDIEYTLFIAVTSTSFGVGDFDALNLRDFDDVVLLPYAVPDSWVAPMHTRHATAAWNSLPRLDAGGTFSAASVTARGKVTDTRVIPYAPEGTLINGHMIQFTLREV